MGRTEEVMIEFLSQAEIIADLFNGYAFDGESVIQPEMLREKERTTTILTDEEREHNSRAKGKHWRKKRDYNTFEVLKKERDIVREVVIGEQRLTLMICGVEEQTKVDYSMPLRVLSYDTLEYLTQARRIAREHKRNKDVKDAEYLSGFAKEDRLIPTLSIVVYAGQEPWDGAMNLDGLLEQNEYIKKIAPLMVKAPLNVLSIFNVEDSSRYHGDLRKLLELLRYAGNWDAMDEYLTQHRSEYLDLDRATIRVMELLLDIDVMSEEARQDEKEEIDVCKAIQEMKERAREEGIMHTFFCLIDDELITIEEAAKRVAMPSEKFTQEYNKYLEEKE